MSRIRNDVPRFRAVYDTPKKKGVRGLVHATPDGKRRACDGVNVGKRWEVTTDPVTCPQCHAKARGVVRAWVDPESLLAQAIGEDTEPIEIDYDPDSPEWWATQ